MRTLLAAALLAALTLPGGGAHALLPQDDAGSGTDAPGAPTASFGIDPGVVYTGHIEGRTGGDSEDWYAFTAPAGAALEARVGAAVGCLGLHDASGAELNVSCSAGYAELGRTNAVATVAGTYYARFWHRPQDVDDTAAQLYRFSVGVDAGAPAPTPLSPPVDLFVDQPDPTPVAPATESGDHVVVAVVDTGVNLYHDFFSAPALDSHPSTWLPGFPAAATSVPLSLDEPTYAAAMAADEDTFAGLRRSTYDGVDDSYDAHLYTFPGTRVVGAVSFGEYDDVTDPTVTTTLPVRDDHGHGTHSAGLAGGVRLDAADGNVLIVAVEVGQGTFVDGIRWAARQPWIDAVTVSLGNTGNVPFTTSPFGERTGVEWATHDAYLSGKPVFVASGNGFSNTGVAPDRCSTYTSGYTGPAWITRVGAAKPDNGNPTWWHCVPVDATAKTQVNSPAADDLERVSYAGGTSASTPNVAGHWAHLMLAAREAGSAVTRAAAVDHLLHAATPPAPAAGTNSPSPYPASLAEQGYGLVDQAALDAARTRLLAGSGPLPRPETETWFAHDRQLRTALWGPGSLTEGDAELPNGQDDAGSGTDAPSTRSSRVPVQPGVRYDGMVDGVVTDDTDWYAFDATAGDVVTVALAGSSDCLEVVSAAEAVVASACATGTGETVTASATLGSTGTWYLKFKSRMPQTYAFGFGRNAPPPAMS